jgi:hypothetical protein
MIAKSAHEKIGKQVRTRLRDDCGADVRILHVETAIRAKTGERIYLYHAALERAPNVLVRTIAVDDEGSPIKLEELQEEEGRSIREIFARTDIDVVRIPLRPSQALGEASIDPNENIIELEQDEALQETIIVTLPRRPSAEKLDVYFLADVTGSMAAALQAVQDASNAILSSVRGSGADVAFGVGSYRDFPGAPSTVFIAQQPITTNDADVVRAINAWSASGGGDIPEGQLYALDRIAADAGGEIGWRPNSKRIVVWFGDAPGHEPICPALTGLASPISTASVAIALREANIAVVAISAATGTATNLDSDPTAGATDYVSACGAPGGFPAQATTIASETGGLHRHDSHSRRHRFRDRGDRSHNRRGSSGSHRRYDPLHRAHLTSGIWRASGRRRSHAGIHHRIPRQRSLRRRAATVRGPTCGCSRWRSRCRKAAAGDRSCVRTAPASTSTTNCLRNRERSQCRCSAPGPHTEWIVGDQRLRP